MSHPVEGRALLMIWDGLRPEFIRPELTPNLCALAKPGDLGEYRLEMWEVEGTRYLAKGWKEVSSA